MPPAGFRWWTKPELVRLQGLLNMMTCREAAALLGRSKGSVQWAAVYYKLTVNPIQQERRAEAREALDTRVRIAHAAVCQGAEIEGVAAAIGLKVSTLKQYFSERRLAIPGRKQRERRRGPAGLKD